MYSDVDSGRRTSRSRILGGRGCVMIQPEQPEAERSKESRRPAFHFNKSLSTIAAVAIAVIGVWLLYRLLPVFLVLVMALFIVSTMNPAVSWFKACGVKRGAAIAILFTSLLIVISFISILTVPVLLAQATDLLRQAPTLQARLEAYLSGSPLTEPFADALHNIRTDALVKTYAANAVAYSSRIAEFIAYSVSAVFLALYFLIDRDRLRGGLYAVVPRSQHLRLARILMNLDTIVGSYLRGQMVLSVLMTAFVLVILTVNGLPNALAIAVFAGLADVLPYLGVFLSTGPVVVAASARGPAVSFAVLALMLAYEEFESRVLVPRIYGRELRLPSSVVLLAILAGGATMGIVGMILALPVAASVRMLIDELQVELPGEPEHIRFSERRKQRDEHAEQEYHRRAGDMPAVQAAAVAVEISRELRKREKDDVLKEMQKTAARTDE